MLAMLPTDLSLTHLLAISVLLISWFCYPVIFKIMGKETINSQLLSVRRQWLKQVTQHGRSPFDSILIGHIVHSVAFFGSATLIVIAGLFSIVMNLESIHSTMTSLHFIDSISIELFTINFSLLALVLTISFFAFVYALRKLVYSIALIGALPVSDGTDNKKLDILIEATTMVITESLKTFNFGIRGYYYAIAAMFLFASPVICILASLLVTGILIYRQMNTSTAHAISDYVQHR